MGSQKTVVVLFNYGGGMRGLIPARIMERIEERTGHRMSDMVDIFCGPSTGAILNAALNVPCPNDPTRPRFKAKHMVRFYEREGAKIFPADRFRDFRGFIHDFNNRTMKIGQLNSLFRHGHYDPAHLSKCLHDLYGKAKLSDSLKSLIVPVFNIDGDRIEVPEEAGETAESPVRTRNNFIDGGGHALWLKSMDQHRHKQPVPDVGMKDAILASCAAPTYFPCHHFDFIDPRDKSNVPVSGIDGSIFDNPCISYHGAIRQHLPPNTRVIMILLGTGYTFRSIKKEDWNRYGGLGVVDPVNDLPLINILFHAPETALFESFSQELGDDLYVLNKSLVNSVSDNTAPNTAIDDASPANLKKMEYFTEALLEDNKDTFDKICDLLSQNRDKKQENPLNLWQKAKRYINI